ncbi:1-deoxy-D-xylulose-5-phosphate synthase, partial [Halomonas marinisediminis]
GTICDNVIEAINLFDDDEGMAHYDMRFVKPIDKTLLHEICKNHKTIITIEDGSIKGGFGSEVLEFVSEQAYQNKVHILGIPDKFI